MSDSDLDKRRSDGDRRRSDEDRLTREMPPFSRLFIIGDKNTTDDDYRQAFEEHGTVLSVRALTHKGTSDRNGMVYIQMKKTSEAAKAIEKLHGTVFANGARSAKVMIASERNPDGSSYSLTDDDLREQTSRLFVLVPKTDAEKDIYEKFGAYGQIKNVTVLIDKKTSESKGLAYITFRTPYEAALAFEGCESNHRPKFADPSSTRKRGRDEEPARRQLDRYDRSPRGPMPGGPYNVSANMGAPIPALPNRDHRHSSGGPLDYLSNYPNRGFKTLLARIPKGLTRNQAARIFNIVPTMESCEVSSNSYSVKDLARVVYSSASCCAYAFEVFSGFEYPPGCPIDVEYDTGMPAAKPERELSPPRSSRYTDDIIGGSWYKDERRGVRSSRSDHESHSNNLFTPFLDENRQPSSRSQLTPDNSECMKRLFIVSKPERIHLEDLQNLFSRFGSLISVQYLPGKNCGYVKYGRASSAVEAMNKLDRQRIGGNSLMVKEADDPPPRKERRYSDSQ